MPQIEVAPVLTRTERDAFIKFPWRIYAHDPVWVPPLIIERRAFLDRKKHPFFEHGDAALFLARRGGEIVGRIMASDDPNYNALHRTNVGCFGMFECIDDVEVARALFAAAAAWLRAKGRNEILGPIDYSTNYLCGLLISGFEHPPMILTSHNPPYYERLIESCGFAKAKDWYAWWIGDPAQAAQRLRRFARRLEGREVASIRPINLKNLDAEAERFRGIYNEAWQNNWGYVPFTEREFAFMTHELKPLADPRLILVAEVDGAPAGFILTLIDINAAIRHANGRLTRFGLPIGLARLLYHKRHIKTARLVALGVVPKYRRHGVAELLVLRIVEEGMMRQGLVGECSLVLEDNVMMNRFLEAIGSYRYKTYRIYSRAIDG